MRDDVNPRFAVRPVVSRQPTSPTRITIGRGNAVYTNGAFSVYGSTAAQSPTTISAGMWNAGTNAWIPADSTWDAGVCYGYLDSGEVVAVAQKFGGITGKVGNSGALIEGGIVYSSTIATYTLSGDVLIIYIVDEF